MVLPKPKNYQTLDTFLDTVSSTACLQGAYESMNFDLSSAFNLVFCSSLLDMLSSSGLPTVMLTGFELT
jgi:hypothetical protein